MNKIKILAIILFFIIAGFYSQKENQLSPAQIYFPSDELKQGDTLLIKIDSPISEGKFDGEKLDFFQTAEKNKAAFLGIDAKEKPGKHILILDYPGGKTIEKEINIAKTDFPTTELLITKKLLEKGYTPQKIISNIQGAENLILKKAISAYTPEAYFNKAFTDPLKEMKIVGAFGTIKTTGSSTVQHLGVDLDAKIGTPVFASNDGLVILTQELPDYGKTLIIDHGLGIYSLYLHLDKFNVLKGVVIKQGEIIGLSGNTGYSIAPHLHFSIKINGANVNPLIFLKTTQDLTIR
ncbi:MAG: M23 family metallopeptidase [bacterium]|nr:M23 family metallopeptidase [bacterium]